MSKIDSLFSTRLSNIADFSFDANVAEVFPDMIARSIPGYPLMIENIGRIAQRYAQPHTSIYDLGCATGTATLSMAKHIDAHATQIVGLDNSQPMVDKCQQYINQYHHICPVQIDCADIQHYPYNTSSVFLMNFTLQFLAPDQRQSMIDKVYDSLTPGGVLILSEKFTAEDTPISDSQTALAQSVENDLLIDLHHQFKSDNGYTDLEISQKRTALENVMLTDSIATHRLRLTQAGFKHIVIWFSCFNFMSLVAIK